jgi:hypothetical protein
MALPQKYMCHKKAQEAQAILLTDLCLLCFFVAMNGTFEAKLVRTDVLMVAAIQHHSKEPNSWRDRI